MDEFRRVLVLTALVSFAAGMLLGSAITGAQCLPPTHLSRGERL
ncbi:hypothetical protein [Gluconobacter albidus]|nr:hypothetical protein [Gluconobacter albidus]